METARQLEPEQSYGKYRPIADLGQGGTASVFLAVARGPSDFNKLVVLKMLKRELADEIDFRQMFLSEARLSARLNHPNVVQTYEILEAKGRPIIVMEYLEGQALSRIINRTRGDGAPAEFPVSMHLRILAESLTGLHYAHDLSDYNGQPLGLVHRDMTPQNVFVSYDGRVCLLDFGIAKLSTGAKENQTAVGVLKGKLRYMPPEQLLGPSVDRRTDVYAAGVMIWEAATGARMWQGMPETTIMQRVATGDIPAPRSVAPNISEELERICMKALAYKREDRYQTAAELQSDLEKYLDDSQYTPRAIGKFVDKLFAEERKQVKAMIERQLASSSLDNAIDAMDGAEWNLPHAGFSEASGPEADSTPRTMTAANVRHARKSNAMFAAGLLTAALVVLVFWKVLPPSQNATASAATNEGHTQDPAMPVEPSAPQVEEDPQPAAPRQVQLRVSVLPAHAKLFIDDEPLGTNPYSAVVPMSAEYHVLRAEAPGYAPEVRSVSYASDLSLELMLLKQQVETPPRPTRRSRPVAQASRPQESEQHVGTARNCDIPYEIDAQGIRRLRRECLQ
jgi:serine/threonine-protein kinase